MENKENKELDNIFENSYWNNSCYSDNNVLRVNRNKFKEEFDLTRQRGDSYYSSPFGLRGRVEKELNPDYPSNSVFDHFEMYDIANKGGYVAIFSPYHGINKTDSCYDKIFNELGYKKYHSNLYALDDEDFSCPTYYKIIPYKKKS